MEYIFKIKILLISYLAGMLGGLTFIVISRIFYDDYQSYDSKCALDVIAIANTYIVYTTLILVIITIIATLAGIWFSKQFSLSKEKEIRENMRDFFEAIDSDSKLPGKFVKELFKHKEISNELHKLIQIRVESELICLFPAQLYKWIKF